MIYLLKRMIPTKIKTHVYDVEDRLKALERHVKETNIALDVLINEPKYKFSCESGFNGQKSRQEIFLGLLSVIDFDSIVETGTYLGNTTGFMAEVFKKNIFTSEISPRYHSIAKMRLAHVSNVNFERMDSRELIRKLANDPKVTTGTTFFYLDAHWYDDLPLREEIELIASNWKEYVIMIDDFRVPNDDGYGYDCYGADKELSLRYILPTISKHNLIPFFPSCHSSRETGNKRGSVILAPKGKISELVDNVVGLNKYQ